MRYTLAHKPNDTEWGQFVFPSLDKAQSTIHSLHTAARLLGAVRLLVFERQPNFLELGLKVTPTGLSTDRLPAGGAVRLDFTRLALVYQPANDSVVEISLEGNTQARLFELLLQSIHRNELGGLLGDAPPNAVEATFAAVDSFTNRIKPKRAELSGAKPLHFDAAQANDYAQALYGVFTGVARFRARLNGSMTPVVVWPEHFDLSFLWFRGERDEQHPHVNFGFAPYSAGIDEPYLYAYAYPYPSDFDPPSLPAGARWNHEGWTGVVLPYGEIARQQAPEATVEEACIAIYRALRPLLSETP